MMDLKLMTGRSVLWKEAECDMEQRAESAEECGLFMSVAHASDARLRTCLMSRSDIICSQFWPVESCLLGQRVSRSCTTGATYGPTHQADLCA